MEETELDRECCFWTLCGLSSPPRGNPRAIRLYSNKLSDASLTVCQCQHVTLMCCQIIAHRKLVSSQFLPSLLVGIFGYNCLLTRAFSQHNNNHIPSSGMLQIFLIFSDISKTYFVSQVKEQFKCFKNMFRCRWPHPTLYVGLSIHPCFYRNNLK
jgi:hypothetical protein